MQLTDVEVRILGSLVEKEATTPDNYPLSLNALTAACNQSSSRDPVMSLTEDQVRWAVNNLRQQSLVRGLQPAESRVLKYQHLLREKLGVEDGELSALCLLMLRGPQTLGEIRARGGRLGGLSDAATVEGAVQVLIGQELAVELPRQHGQKEERYAHLLSGAPVAAAPPAVDEPAIAHAQVAPAGDELSALRAEIDELGRALADLRAEFDAFRRQFG